MRTITNSVIQIDYPDDLVFSGDLNRVCVTKSTTLTHIELSFIIDSFTYNENLYFLSNKIEFSLSEILELIFNRSVLEEFPTIAEFDFTIKSYNNTDLIDEIDLSITNVFLGKRRVFDKLGVVPTISTCDYFPECGVSYVYFYNDITKNASVILENGSTSFVSEVIPSMLPINLKETADTFGEFKSIILEDPTNTEPKITITLNKVCAGVGEMIGIRFKNRFGIWRYYYAIIKTENIGAVNGVSLWFLENNLTELNGLYSEQNKKNSQSINIYRESVNKETANDFSDIIYSDYVCVYDVINSTWIPVRVTTNTFSIVKKEELFDINLTLLLQSENG